MKRHLLNRNRALAVLLAILLNFFSFSCAMATRQLNNATTDRSWTTASGLGTVSSGDYVQLDGVKVTLGNAQDTQTQWTWNSSNKGYIPSQMPSVDGTSSTLVTAFSEASPYGQIPERGCFLKLEATKAGTLTVSCKPSTDASQKLVIVTADSSNPDVIAEVKVESGIWNASYDVEVEAGKTYYFFQLAYPGKLTSYRFTLRGISFSVEGEKPIKVFTIGDSTMANKTSATERGWGMLFPQFVDASLVTVVNKAVDGRSTLSFINEGRWQDVVNQLAEGDYVLIQFGHNDEKTNASLHTDPQSTYKANLRKFINETKAKGANPVLLTPIVRRMFGADGNVNDEHTEYAEAVRELATECDVPLIDMNNYSRCYENIAGIVGSRALHEYFPGNEIDNTHLCQFGAYITARCIAEQIAANDDIHIAVNPSPMAMTGAYASTLEYAQKMFNATYPDNEAPATLEEIDALVRSLRADSRKNLKNEDLPADATFAVVNPDFAEGFCWYNSVQGTRPMGWTVEKSTSGQENISVKTENGMNYFTVWASTINYIDISQTVTGLADGVYQLSAKVKASSGSSDGGAFIYASSGGKTVSQNAQQPETWEELKVVCQVKRGRLNIGLHSDNGWYGRLADVKLAYLSTSSTGISEVMSESKHESRVYDLCGRCVTKPVKGVYVVDGKKKLFRDTSVK